PRAARPRTAEPLEDGLPDLPGDSIPDRERRARDGLVLRGRLHLVRVARPGPGAERTSQPVGVCAPLRRTGQCVRLPAHRPLPAWQPAGGGRRTARDLRGRSRGLSRKNTARAVAVVLLACAWAAAAWLLWRSRLPGSLHLPSVRASDYFSRAQL